MAEWTFLTKHALVLSLVANNPSITGIELARKIGATERQIRRVIADLYEEGYIEKFREGRGTRYRVNPDKSLRHQTHEEVGIDEFLETLGWQKPAETGPSSGKSSRKS